VRVAGTHPGSALGAPLLGSDRLRLMHAGREHRVSGLDEALANELRKGTEGFKPG
jgi:hypothetical protein